MIMSIDAEKTFGKNSISEYDLQKDVNSWINCICNV